jgi:hypothetical protein
MIAGLVTQATPPHTVASFGRLAAVSENTALDVTTFSSASEDGMARLWLVLTPDSAGTLVSRP